MNEIPMLDYYRGKPVDEMTHEEAIAAVKQLGHELMRTWGYRQQERAFGLDKKPGENTWLT